jgi:hypothetical protein
MKNQLARFLAVFVALFATACGPSLSNLHARATQGQVQQEAPVHAHQVVLVRAPRTVVWSILTDIKSWPEWQTNVTEAQSPASLAPGSTFTWTNNGNKIVSKLARINTHQEIAWTGSVSMAKAIHIYRLTEPSPGVTRIEVEETMDGFLLTWFYGQKDLDADMAKTLAQLKEVSESRARK